MSRLSSSFRSVVTFVGVAAFTAAAGLAVAWPHTTYADGEQPVAQYTAEGVKIGGVLVKGELVRDTKSKTGWVVVVVANNKSDAVATVSIEADLTRTVASPMSRVAPMPQTAWNTTETLTLAAHQQIVKRYDVPAAIATQVTAAKVADAAPQQAKQPPQMRTRISYAIRVIQPAAAAPVQSAAPARPVLPAQAAQPAMSAQPTMLAPNAPQMPIVMQTF